MQAREQALVIELVSESGGVVQDLNGLQAYIAGIQQGLQQRELEGLAAITPEPNSYAATNKAAAMSKVLRRKQLWASTGKALALQGTQDSHGTALTGDEAAEALAQHWGGAFAPRDGDEGSWQHLQAFVQQAPR